MKVIVGVSGFYGGTWYGEGGDEVDIPDAIAKPFMAPYGDQLSTSTKKVEKAPAKAVVVKPASSESVA